MGGEQTAEGIRAVTSLPADIPGTVRMDHRLVRSWSSEEKARLCEKAICFGGGVKKKKTWG